MSDNRDKPAGTDPDHDPDATVSLPPRTSAKPDDDATVMMGSRKAFENPDEDATVTMASRNAFKEPDEDVTVMMPPGGFKPPAEPLAAFKTEADPDRTVVATRPPIGSVPIETPSRMPMIAGGMVVVAVIAYFVMTGDKAPAPVAPRPQSAAPAPVAAPATPATSPANPVAASVAPAAPAASAAPSAPSAPASTTSKLSNLLAADVKRGSIGVSEQAGGATITLPATNQFASGGVDPDAKMRPLLVSIAAALNKTTGSIVVIGHADATPSSNPKFPSNQALSEARAGSVAKVLMAGLSNPKRLSSEGASDSQPVAPSDTVENRAKNRRVVIILKPAS